MHQYILSEDGTTPIPARDMNEWGRFFEKQDKRRVAKETIGEAEVSTVFLGLDHGCGDGPPVLWETMVFGGPLDQEQDRCSGNREQAEAMHAKMVERVRCANVADEPRGKARPHSP